MKGSKSQSIQGEIARFTRHRGCWVHFLANVILITLMLQADDIYASQEIMQRGDVQGHPIVAYGDECQVRGWCFKVHHFDGLHIVETIVDSKGEFEVIQLERDRRHLAPSCETIPQTIEGSNILTCGDEPYFSTCGSFTFSCFEVYDQGSYSVIIAYGGLGDIIQTIIGPPIESEDEDGGEDEGE